MVGGGDYHQPPATTATTSHHHNNQTPFTNKCWPVTESCCTSHNLVSILKTFSAPESNFKNCPMTIHPTTLPADLLLQLASLKKTNKQHLSNASYNFACKSALAARFSEGAKRQHLSDASYDFSSKSALTARFSEKAKKQHISNASYNSTCRSALTTRFSKKKSLTTS